VSRPALYWFAGSQEGGYQDILTWVMRTPTLTFVGLWENLDKPFVRKPSPWCWRWALDGRGSVIIRNDGGPLFRHRFNLKIGVFFGGGWAMIKEEPLPPVTYCFLDLTFHVAHFSCFFVVL